MVLFQVLLHLIISYYDSGKCSSRDVASASMTCVKYAMATENLVTDSERNADVNDTQQQQASSPAMSGGTTTHRFSDNNDTRQLRLVCSRLTGWTPCQRKSRSVWTRGRCSTVPSVRAERRNVVRNSVRNSKFDLPLSSVAETHYLNLI